MFDTEKIIVDLVFNEVSAALSTRLSGTLQTQMTRLHKKDYFKGKPVQRRAVPLLPDFINVVL